GVAIRKARHAERAAHQASLAANAATSQTARARIDVARLKAQLGGTRITVNAVAALCYAFRHASVPARRNYATNIGITVAHGVANACDYALVPDRKPPR